MQCHDLLILISLTQKGSDPQQRCAICLKCRVCTWWVEFHSMKLTITCTHYFWVLYNCQLYKSGYCFMVPVVFYRPFESFVLLFFIYSVRHIVLVSRLMPLFGILTLVFFFISIWISQLSISHWDISCIWLFTKWPKQWCSLQCSHFH